MYSTILVKRTEGIGLLTLNRPDALNALNLLMREEIRLALEELGKDDEVRVVVITGAGRAFCAGGDVKEQTGGFDASSGRERIRNLDRLLMTMVNLEKPIICAVNGVATGAGCNLVLAADLIVAAEEARFSEIFIQIGLIPDFGGMYFLPRLVGLPRAKEMVFTGQMLTAREAKEMGLINRVVPRAELEPVVFELARDIARKSPTAIRLAKSILNRSLSCDLPTLLELEAFAQGICFQSEEHRELLREFLAKRREK
ncbi:MAG: enoyl-CoA hydratase/isomerase family protein [Firmicutes bacterium]|nr:enoyl-CoA hydratase/isomerase family protein [Bacillota bacterium]